ncbi:MAG: hypothetical protein ABL904_12455 [Hyphomicrobiaceae bacterium]
MNCFFTAAAILAFLVGLFHSVLGEVMIFASFRQGGLIPSNGGGLLRESNVRILWASWHLLTVLGWGMAVILLALAMPGLQSPAQAIIVPAIALSMLLGSALVAIGTKARHPGWIGLLGVAVLVWLGRPG